MTVTTFLATTLNTSADDGPQTGPPSPQNAASYLLPVLGGAVAGAVATGPMTVFMMAAHRFLPLRQRHSLPPKAITMDLLNRVNLKQHLNRKQRKRATIVAHFAYGTGLGAAYGSFSRAIPAPPLLKGVAFALVAWAGSYLGWLPAFDVSGSAPDQSMRRNALMIGAHVVWGAVAGPISAGFERH